MHERKIAEQNQRKADRLYDLKMKEMASRAADLEQAEDECRKAIVQATKDYNSALVSSLSRFIMAKPFVA